MWQFAVVWMITSQSWLRESLEKCQTLIDVSVIFVQAMSFDQTIDQCMPSADTTDPCRLAELLPTEREGFGFQKKFTVLYLN